MSNVKKRPTRKPAKNGIPPGTQSVKITDRAYRTFARIAKNEQRTLVAVIDRAAAHYDAATKGGKES